MVVLAIWLTLHFGGLIAVCYLDPKNLSGKHTRKVAQ